MAGCASRNTASSMIAPWNFIDLKIAESRYIALEFYLRTSSRLGPKTQPDRAEPESGRVGEEEEGSEVGAPKDSASILLIRQ